MNENKREDHIRKGMERWRGTVVVGMAMLLAALAFPAFGESGPVGQSGEKGEDASESAAGSGEASSEDASQDEKQKAEKQKAEDAALFERLIVDPYNRRYGRPPGDGWIPMPGTKTELRFGGFVQLNVIHDFQDAGFAFGDFIPALIPVPTEDTTNTEFDVRTSRVTFETRTNTETYGSVKTMISMDFAGDENENSIQPRLRQAYVTWVGAYSKISYTAGQTWTTFMDLNVWPEIFDLEGPNGMTGLRQGLIRGGHRIGRDERLIFDFSLEQPETFVQNGSGLRDWPDVVARINWGRDWGHLQGAAVGRWLVGESLAGTGKDTAFGWGLSFSGSWKVPGTKRKDSPDDEIGVRQDQIQFQLQAGSGIGRYVFDLGSAPSPQDAVYDDTTMELEPLDETGGFVAYHHWWSNKWRSAFIYGLVRVDNLAVQPSTEFKRTTYALANILYRPFRRMDTGLEYYWGERENVDGQTGHAHRIMLTANFGF